MLLSDKSNKSASNKTFEEKKEYYRTSKIEPNPSVAKYGKWTVEEIENRQKEMAEYAADIWRK